MMKDKETKKSNSKGSIFIIIGLLLIVAAIFLTAYNLYDNRRAEKSVAQVLLQLEGSIASETAAELIEEPEFTSSNDNENIAIPETTEAAPESASPDEIIIPDYILNPKMDMPEKAVEDNSYIGVLRIPSLGLELPIISEWSYDSLKTAPCRYSGSAYQDNLVICGHDYTSHFGRLKYLEEGDTAVLTDMDGNVFTYELAETEILQPTAVDEMESGDWSLTLFTCTIGGQSRLTLRFVLIQDE
ncbi:MAG: sortase [Eubacteriales bacterium]